MRARIALGVDALQPAKRHAIHPHSEIRAIDELVTLDRELGEVGVVDDDRGVGREQEQPDDHHGRVATARAEDQDADPGERKEGVRGPEEREVRADRAHESSLEARSTGPMSSRRSISWSASVTRPSSGDSRRRSW